MIVFATPLIMLDVVHGDREEIADLKDQRDTTKKTITTLTYEIITKKQTINNIENELDIEKNNLRELRKTNNDTWDSIELIYNKKSEIEQIKIELSDENKLLQLLITEKLNNQKNLTSLQNEIKETEKLLEQENINTIQLSINNTNTNSTNFDHNIVQKNIGIILSNTCIQMIKNNLNNNTCPTYEELLFLDSSNIVISGGFAYEDNMFQRMSNNFENGWKWYDTTFNDELRLFVDPPFNLQNRIPIIEITPNLETYTTFESRTIHDNQRIIFHDRYVKDNCKYAKIDSKVWLDLLPDTVNYLRYGCDGNYTTFNNTESIQLPITQIDITESPNWQEAQWFKESKILCKMICKEY